jgi:hypothetical protein
MPTKWVSFDCFGTLVNLHGGISDILKPLAENRGETDWSLRPIQPHQLRIVDDAKNIEARTKP